MKIRPVFLQHGFTLMETVVALVLLAIVSVVITSANGNLFFRSTAMQTAQQGTQLLQACMDKLIAIRKASGYSGVTSSGCSTISGVTVSTATACPSQLDDLTTFPGCKQFQITATGVGKPITLIFVNY